MLVQKHIHFNGVNGIRAICALAVVVSHSLLSLSFIGIKAGPILGLALYGVTAFFALSGFLITYLLIQEKSFFKTISVRKFYLRRILRIWPLYFGYMLIAIFADIFIFNFTDFSSFKFYLLFFPNIPFAYNNVHMETFIPIFFVGHYWSLGVEEQFYIFYPWLIKWFKKLLLVLFSVFTLMIGLKLFAKFWSYKSGNPFWYAWASSTPFDAMVIGGLGAWAYKEYPAVILRLSKIRILQWCIAGIVFLILIDRLELLNPFSHLLTAAVTVIVIYYAHLLEKPYINLENRYIHYLGKISYGIYVYHPLVIGLAGLFIKKLAVSAEVKTILFFVIIIVATILLASLSYKYFEKHFLNIKLEYAIVKNND